MSQYANAITVEYDLAATTATSTPSYTTLGEVYDVSGPSLSADALDGTAHGDSWRTFVGGLKDGGEISLSVRLETDNTSQVDLKDEIGNSFLVRLQFPASAGAITQPLEVKADVVMTGFDISGPHDGLLDASVTLKLSGAPVWTDEA